MNVHGGDDGLPIYRQKLVLTSRWHDYKCGAGLSFVSNCVPMPEPGTASSSSCRHTCVVSAFTLWLLRSDAFWVSTCRLDLSLLATIATLPNMGTDTVKPAGSGQQQESANARASSRASDSAGKTAVYNC